MSPSTPHIASQLRHLIFYHLDNDFLENALFMAERLQALEPRSPDAAHLLSLCNLRLRRYKAAHDHSLRYGNSGKHLGCSFVFAQACLALKLYSEGIVALQKARHLRSGDGNLNKQSENTKRFLPDAAAVNCLAGKLYRGRLDFDKATDCFVEALKLNPFMWDAFTALCDMGISVNPAIVFRSSPELLALMTVQQQGENRQEDIPLHSGPLAHQSSSVCNQILTPNGDPFNPPARIAGEVAPKTGGTSLLSKLNGLKMPTESQDRRVHQEMNETPTAINRDDTDVMMGNEYDRIREPPDAPARKPRTLHEQRLDVGQDAGPRRIPSGRIRPQNESESSNGAQGIDTTKTLRVPNVNHKRTISGHSTHSSASATTDTNAGPQTRRSIRLLSQMRPSSNKSAPHEGLFSREGRELKKARPIGPKGKTAPTVGRVVSGNRKPMEKPDPNSKETRSFVNQSNHNPPLGALAKPPQPEVPQPEESLRWLLDLFLKFASGYFSLSRYKCSTAIDHFNSVIASQRETPWVLAQIGRALYEQSKYREAAEVFSRIRKLAPSRVQDMEVYTTSLWHLKSNVELAWLARELLDTDSHAPQAWCAVGNAWSLERDHEQAITCFRRATQLDPNFAYAHTLEGHEYVENEEFEKATECYRTAIERDMRAYSAWYGLGKVNEKIGKYSDAEKYYTMAAKINGANALLVVYIGVVSLHALCQR